MSRLDQLFFNWQPSHSPLGAARPASSLCLPRTSSWACWRFKKRSSVAAPRDVGRKKWWGEEAIRYHPGDIPREVDPPPGRENPSDGDTAKRCQAHLTRNGLLIERGFLCVLFFFPASCYNACEVARAIHTLCTALKSNSHGENGRGGGGGTQIHRAGGNELFPDPKRNRGGSSFHLV